MSFKVNDPVFNGVGEPALVRKVDKASQKTELDQDQQMVRQAFRHGYLKGMEPETRLDFNSFMDEIGNETEPSKKAERLQEKITELEDNFSPKNYLLLNYLKAELSHIMNTYHYHPRIFSVRDDGLY
ncbi:MAG: hypothetical protein H6618_06935 [Deltaproteobacteria bacterium]|nr:hypothetical protein [Deltaproteobacteria bacterium]